MKPLAVSLGVLTDTTLETGEQQPHPVTEDTYK